MGLSEKEELELLELEEQEYQYKKAKKAPDAPNETGRLEALARGVADTRTYGNSDELGGVQDVAMDYGQRALNALGMADKSPGQVDQELKDQGFTGDLGPSNVKDIYLSGRNDERAKNKKAKEDQPFFYGGGQLVGAALAPSILPGSNLTTRGALEGGAYAEGSSEADNLKDVALDTAKGAGIGGAIGLATSKGQDVASYLGDKLKYSMPANSVGEFAKNNPELVGGTIGLATHGPVGGVTGALAGERTIPKIVNKLDPLLNKFDESFQSIMQGLPSKYKQIMENAGRRGVQSQAVQHFLLGQRDPEYQDITKQDK